nr:hypothetical protein [Clostridia bacterium]
MKKLALILLAAMLLPALVACGGDTDTGTADTTAADAAETTTAAETEEEKITDDLPSDLNYNGYEFKLHSRYAPIYFNYTVGAQEENGDVVNDAIYARDRALEDRLNIKFTETTYDNASQGQEVPRTLIMAGDDTYDLFVGRNLQSFAWAADGLLINWEQLDYVDLDKPYWDASINESLVLNDKMFFAAGAFNLTAYEWTHVLLFNKKMHENLGLENLYDLVTDGKWTYDKFESLAKTAVAVVNGDGVMDTNDRYGLISYNAQVLPGFWIGAGTQTIDRDSDGKFVYSTPSNEKFINIYNKVIEDMYDEQIWYQMPRNMTDFMDQIQPFIDEKGLFCNANFFRISKLRAMETDFGILPYPKWEESQDDYYSRIEGCEMPVVPMTNKDLDRTGAILEALASGSYYTVVPAYYDMAITGKYARDEESIEMLNIITGNRVFDYGDTILCTWMRDGVIRNSFEANTRDIVSALVSNEGTVNAQLVKLNGDY